MAEDFRKVLASIRTAADVKRYAALYNRAFASVIAEDDNAEFDQTEMYEKFIDLIQKKPIWQDLILETQGKNKDQVENITRSYPPYELFKNLYPTFTESLSVLKNKLRNYPGGNFDLGYVLSSHALIRNFMDSPEGKKHEELYNILLDLGIMFLNFTFAVDAINANTFLTPDTEASFILSPEIERKLSSYTRLGPPDRVNFTISLQHIRNAQGVKEIARLYNYFFRLPIAVALPKYLNFSRTDLYEKLITLLIQNRDWQNLILNTENKNINEIKMLIGRYPDESQIQLVNSALKIFAKKDKATLQKKIEESLEIFNPGKIFSPNYVIFPEGTTPATRNHIAYTTTVSRTPYTGQRQFVMLMTKLGEMMINFEYVLESLKEEEISDF